MLVVSMQCVGQGHARTELGPTRSEETGTADEMLVDVRLMLHSLAVLGAVTKRQGNDSVGHSMHVVWGTLDNDSL